MTARYSCNSRTSDAYTASYCLSVLAAIAGGEGLASGETVVEYAQRHLTKLQETGYIEEQARPVEPHPVVDVQAACTERMRQLEPNGYPEKAVHA